MVVLVGGCERLSEQPKIDGRTTGDRRQGICEAEQGRLARQRTRGLNEEERVVGSHRRVNDRRLLVANARRCSAAKTDGRRGDRVARAEEGAGCRGRRDQRGLAVDFGGLRF